MGLSGKIPQNEKAHSGLLLGAFIRASGEMADAQASGACIRKDVGVQVPPRPPKQCSRLVTEKRGFLILA